MTRRKTSERCGGCENFDMADTWRSTFYGIFCEGTCSRTGRAIHNMHYACKDYMPCCVGNIMIMTEEEVRDKMQEGFDRIQPKIGEMTNIIMDAYEAGFNTCFELLTGQKFK